MEIKDHEKNLKNQSEKKPLSTKPADEGHIFKEELRTTKKTIELFEALGKKMSQGKKSPLIKKLDNKRIFQFEQFSKFNNSSDESETKDLSGLDHEKPFAVKNETNDSNSDWFFDDAKANEAKIEDLINKEAEKIASRENGCERALSFEEENLSDVSEKLADEIIHEDQELSTIDRLILLEELEIIGNDSDRKGLDNIDDELILENEVADISNGDAESLDAANNKDYNDEINSSDALYENELVEKALHQMKSENIIDKANSGESIQKNEKAPTQEFVSNDSSPYVEALEASRSNQSIRYSGLVKIKPNLVDKISKEYEIYLNQKTLMTKRNKMTKPEQKTVKAKHLLPISIDRSKTSLADSFILKDKAKEIKNSEGENHYKEAEHIEEDFLNLAKSKVLTNQQDIIKLAYVDGKIKKTESSILGRIFLCACFSQ